MLCLNSTRVFHKADSAATHCHHSLPLLTATAHYHQWLSPITAIAHYHHTLPPLIVTTDCHHSLPPLTATTLSHRPLLSLNACHLLALVGGTKCHSRTLLASSRWHSVILTATATATKFTTATIDRFIVTTPDTGFTSLILTGPTLGPHRDNAAIYIYLLHSVVIILFIAIKVIIPLQLLAINNFFVTRFVAIENIFIPSKNYQICL